MERYIRSRRPSTPARRRSLAAMGRTIANAATVAAVLSFAVGREPSPSRPRAPKGGLAVAGRFYKGGQLLPATTAPAVVHGEPDPAPVHREPAPGPVEVVCDAGPPDYQPSESDEAWDAGWRFGRSGRSIYDGPGEPEGWPGYRDLQIAFCSGVRAGRSARQAAHFREMGRSLGLAGYRECEPPGGLTGPERAAYRDGHASGLAEFEEERAYGAWVDSCEREARERECRITDRDVYPAGCMS